MRAPATRGRTVALSLAAGAVLALSTLVLPGAPGEAAPAADPVAATYVVEGARDRTDRSAVASTGAAVLEVQDHGVLLVQATPQEAAALQDQGYRATLQQAATAAALPGLEDLPDLGLLGFPSQDSGFHDHAETVAAVEASAAANPALVQRFSLGESYEGRDLVAAKVSADVATDEDEPEVLFTCNQHAREHLTVEMCLAILDTLVSGYGSDPRVTELLDTREVWIAFMVNPDGVEHDIAGGTYKAWRKNRQPNPGSSAVGTDLNRNWGHEWGCCGGSSSSPSSETYRGSDAFSAVETQVVRDFVLSRVVGGEQQITAHIDWHTYSELVLWPYGFTYDETAPGLTQDDRDAHAALGVSMAESNGYTAQQSSDLYVTDGSINDWMWGTQKIFSYTFEMYPESAFGTSGFYPGDEVIDRETERNREAVLQLLEAADCVYEVIGKADQYCS